MLSFIVPAYNEELELPATLTAIHSAAAGHEYEIIVVDDGSTDATAQIARTARAKVIPIQRRQIAAARNCGGKAARGDILFFVDADTRINARLVRDALAALAAGGSGGSARIEAHGPVPLWGRIFLKVFCALYFANNLGAGAFLFTTRENFRTVDGFDEALFVGEEIFFSKALKKLGSFRILREPISTSARKLRLYSGGEIFRQTIGIIFRGMRGARSRDKLDFWYGGKRETKLAAVSEGCAGLD